MHNYRLAIVPTLAFAATLTFGACKGGDKAASPEEVCKHMVGLAEKSDNPRAKRMIERGADDCKKELDEVKKEFGADVLTKVSACAMKLTDFDAMRDCNPKKFVNKDGDKGAAGGKELNDKVRLARTTEAKVFLKKLYDGARVYYMDAGANAQSLTPTPPQFPGPSVGPTPAKGACCKGKDKQCEPDAKNWDNPVWIALAFSVDDPHYYSYEYKVAPDNKGFSVMAYGDLDCDGKFSTFTMEAKMGPDGPSGNAEIKEDNPLE